MENKELDLSGLLNDIKIHEIIVMDNDCTNRNGYVTKFITDIVPNVGECLYIRGDWWNILSKGYYIDEESEENDDMPVSTDIYVFCKKQEPPQ